MEPRRSLVMRRNPIVGYIDRLGYAWCVRCVPKSSALKAPVDSVDSGNAAASHCQCEQCGETFVFDPSLLVSDDF